MYVSCLLFLYSFYVCQKDRFLTVLYHSHCTSITYFTAENIFHCRKYSRRHFWDGQWGIVLRKQRHKIRTTKGEKSCQALWCKTLLLTRWVNMKECETLKSKLKPSVKSPHPKGYCINAPEITGSKEKRKRVGQSSWAKLALTVGRVSCYWAELVGLSW